MHAPNITTTSSTPLTEWELQIQLQQALSDRFTGQIQITFSDGKTETVLVQRGIIRNLYIRNHRVPDLNWEILLKQFGTGMLNIVPYPSRALTLQKVILEEITPPQPTLSDTSQLMTLFSLAEYSPNPTLFHIRWEQAEAFVLVAGGHIPIRRVVLITPSEVEEGNVAFDHIPAWEEAQCTVTVYRGDIKSQAWLEIHLNILLEWYCQDILDHYQQLTGMVMVKSILQSLSVLAQIRKWNISTQNQQFQDVTLFSNAEEMGHAYREMLSAIRMRIEPIIGSSLMQYLIKQCTERTTGVYKTIEEIFGLVEGGQ